jgi:hypothetical protein
LVFVFIPFVVLGLELKAFTLSHSTSHFLWWVFRDRVSQTLCPGWLRTTILLISASWVATITGVSYWHLAKNKFFIIQELHDFQKMWSKSRSSIKLLKPELC